MTVRDGSPLSSALMVPLFCVPLLVKVNPRSGWSPTTMVPKSKTCALAVSWAPGLPPSPVPPSPTMPLPMVSVTLLSWLAMTVSELIPVSSATPAAFFAVAMMTR